MDVIADFVEPWPDFLTAILIFLTSLATAVGILARSLRRVGARAGTLSGVTPLAYAGWFAFIGGFSRFYDLLSGIHPNRRFWHSQWLSAKDLYRDLRPVLGTLEGPLLDLGSGNKPYAGWMPRVSEHLGADVFPGDGVDLVIRDGERWPLESNHFQSALCTQVLQVVGDVPHLLDELHRVLKPGGIAVIAAPFCYHDMTGPSSEGGYKDYWRHSENGALKLLGRRFEVMEVRRQGGIGSTLGLMLLNWIRLSVARNAATLFLLVVLLPFWLLFCVLVNFAGTVMDKIDKTGLFYHNVLLVVRKPSTD